MQPRKSSRLAGKEPEELPDVTVRRPRQRAPPLQIEYPDQDELDEFHQSPAEVFRRAITAFPYNGPRTNLPLAVPGQSSSSSSNQQVVNVPVNPQVNNAAPIKNTRQLPAYEPANMADDINYIDDDYVHPDGAVGGVENYYGENQWPADARRGAVDDVFKENTGPYGNLFARRQSANQRAHAAATKQRLRNWVLAHGGREENGKLKFPRGMRAPDVMRQALSQGLPHKPTAAEKLSEALGVKVKPGALRWARATVRDTESRTVLFRKAAVILKSARVAAEYQVITVPLLRRIYQHMKAQGASMDALLEYQHKLREAKREANPAAALERLRQESIARAAAKKGITPDAEAAARDAAKARRRAAAPAKRAIGNVIGGEYTLGRKRIRASNSRRNERTAKAYNEQEKRLKESGGQPKKKTGMYQGYRY